MSPTRRLQAHWARRLKDSGFEDIETPGGALVGSIDGYGTAEQRWHDAPARWHDREAIERYYSLALQFIHSRRYARLPRIRQRIWATHALGLSNVEVAMQTGSTLKAVRVAVAACRVLAGLPAKTSTLGHGRRP